MKQIIRYLFVGGGAVFIDYISYFALMRFVAVQPSIAKGASYIMGALFAFIMNKIWTFESDEPTHKAFGKFAALYFSTFLANVSINSAILWIFGGKQIAFILATATSIVLNYIGQKFWVFRSR